MGLLPASVQARRSGRRRRPPADDPLRGSPRPRPRQDRLQGGRPRHRPVPAPSRRPLDGRRPRAAIPPGRPAERRRDAHGQRHPRRPGQGRRRHHRPADRRCGPADRRRAGRRRSPHDRERRRPRRDRQQRWAATRGLRLPAVLGAERELDPARLGQDLDGLVLRRRRRRERQPAEAGHAMVRRPSAGAAGRAPR